MMLRADTAPASVQAKKQMHVRHSQMMRLRRGGTQPGADGVESDGKGSPKVILIASLAGAAALIVAAVLVVSATRKPSPRQPAEVPVAQVLSASLPAAQAPSQLPAGNVGPDLVSGRGVTPGDALQKREQSASAQARPSAPAPDRTPDKNEEMWQYATDFAQKNPQKFAEAIAHFQTLKEHAVGTKYAMMAATEIQRLTQAQKTAAEQAVAKALDDLKAACAPLLAKQDYAAAAKFYRDYAGPLAKETESQRSALAKEHQTKAETTAAEQSQAAQAGKQKVDTALTAAAADLLNGKTAEALARWGTLLKEALPEAEKSRAEKARGILAELASVDATLLKSFEVQTGKEIDVTVGGRVQKVTITGVNGGLVQAERKMGPAVVAVNFGVAQLTTEERLRRLEGRATPETLALYAGLMARAEQQHEEATKRLAGAGVLAEPLLANLKATAAAQKEMLAQRAYGEALRGLNLSGGETNWSAVSAKLPKTAPATAVAETTRKALEDFRSRYADTQFAGAHREVTEQLFAYVAPPAAKQPTTARPAVASTNAAAAATRARIRTVAALHAALQAVNPEYNSKGRERLWRLI
jgi:hypothetical protein